MREPPGLASRRVVVRPLQSPHGLPGGVRDRSKRDLAVAAGGPGLREVTMLSRLDRKTVRRPVQTAQAVGLA